MKPEGRVRWAPGAFHWLSEAMTELVKEAEDSGKDIEMSFEHRAVGRCEYRIKLVKREDKKRMFSLPPIAIVG